LPNYLADHKRRVVLGNGIFSNLKRLVMALLRAQNVD